MQKQRRHQTILKLITDRRISRQEELAELLEARGFSVTQSSVSRDLDELEIIKTGGFYALPRKIPNELSFGLISLETAGENLIVAKCESGLASAVAVRLDDAKIDEIAGTIAGDDTIFVAVRDKTNQKQALKKIWEIFEK